MEKQEPKFFACEKCQVLIEQLCGEANDFSCNGAALTKLVPNTSEGAQEKHLPVVEQDGNRVSVKVGSVFHPMTEEHSIEWVYLQTEKGCQKINLAKDSQPTAEFYLSDGDHPIAAYAYCNLHGFWKSDI